MIFGEAPGELINPASALRELSQRVSALIKKYETSHECGFKDSERQLHAPFAHTECAVTEEALAGQAVSICRSCSSTVRCIAGPVAARRPTRLPQVR